MEIYTIINNPLPSNTYIIVEDGHCIIIDPGSKESSVYEVFIDSNHYIVDYIVLTHEHFDHTWSADLLRKKYNVPIICSKRCAERISIPLNYFNRLYFNDPTFFSIQKIEKTVIDGDYFRWYNHKISFILTPGHTLSSLCVIIDNIFFSGDTLIKDVKPFIKKRHEGSFQDFKKSINRIFDLLSLSTIVYPGHGKQFLLKDVKDYLYGLLQSQ